MLNLSLSILEIIVLMLGAVFLGITIHFFIASRRSYKTSVPVSSKANKDMEEWKYKYFNEIDLKDKELTILKQQLTDAEENSNIYSIEAEEMRRENKRLLAEIEAIRKTVPAREKPDYIDQLRQAQKNLLEHNEKINQLLEQVDFIKEAEEKQKEIVKNNEELSGQVNDLKFRLSQKEKEVSNIRQKEVLTKEMTSMLDSTYNEFNVLQSKIQKLESQVNSSKMINMEYEELKEGHYKLSRDYEDQKIKYHTASTENQQLQLQLAETENNLKEANFQRQQLQKRIAYLEELNNDLQVVSDANKKLEGQIKRIGELESMLNVVSEERDELVRRRTDES